MLEARYACQTADHRLSRRMFLGASALGVCGLASQSAATELKKSEKRVLVIFLAGGLSQFESWDPKPGTEHGGPFGTIQTAVPGTIISELLPHTAKQMKRIALIRSLNSLINDHSAGFTIMQTGRKPEAAMDYPYLGSIAAKLLPKNPDGLPGYMHIFPKSVGHSKVDAAFLGPAFNPIAIVDGKPPENLLRPDSLTADADQSRDALRKKLTDRFARSRRSAATEAYGESFNQAEKIYRKAGIFEVSKEPAKLAEKYGQHDFGRHMLLARRLLESGINYVKVTHSNYDTHHENFDFHIEQLGEFDRTFATLLDDLADRGMLESTLVIVMSEMGRTPKINEGFGRDHWAKCWSVALAGCGIKGGVVHGKTNATGTEVAKDEVLPSHLFHTYLRALGIDSTKNFYPNDRPIPYAEATAGPIQEVLA
jgi:hypothetical protein